MIVLDTHIWLWWVNQDSEFLKPLWLEIIEQVNVKARRFVSHEQLKIELFGFV